MNQEYNEEFWGKKLGVYNGSAHKSSAADVVRHTWKRRDEESPEIPGWYCIWHENEPYFNATGKQVAYFDDMDKTWWIYSDVKTLTPNNYFTHWVELPDPPGV